MPPTIEPARPEDLAPVCDLLRRSALPTDGLGEHLAGLLVARQAGGIAGCVALERYRDGALLRSLAVEPALRGTGLGHRLVEAAVDRAAADGVPVLCLLTTTAERFFPRFGFEAIARDQVPEGVRRSVEFVSACPASAIVMARRLDARRRG